MNSPYLLCKLRAPLSSRTELRASASGFLYTPLPAGLAGNITSEMNRAGASRFQPPTPDRTRKGIEQDIERVYNRWMAEQWEDHLLRSVGGESVEQEQVVFGISGTGDEKTMGYVTKDACPGVGDDIEHVPGKSFYDLVSPITSHQSLPSCSPTLLTLPVSLHPSSPPYTPGCNPQRGPHPVKARLKTD